jgi:hypothetical protein
MMGKVGAFFEAAMMYCGGGCSKAARTERMEESFDLDNGSLTCKTR